MKCMKFSKNGGIAKDVGCVALCEAERAKAFADAKVLRSTVNVSLLFYIFIGAHFIS